jgi:hypothetical protein
LDPGPWTLFWSGAYRYEPNTKVDLRWRGSIAWTYDQVVFLGWIIRKFLIKKTLATNAKGKREGFSFKIDSKLFFPRGFSLQCGKQWTLCPQGATHNEVMCRVMKKSQLFCERGSGMWQESSIRPKFWELSGSRTVPGIKIWLNSTLQMDGWDWISEERRHLLCKVPQRNLSKLTHNCIEAETSLRVRCLPESTSTGKILVVVYQAFTFTENFYVRMWLQGNPFNLHNCPQWPDLTCQNPPWK